SWHNVSGNFPRWCSFNCWKLMASGRGVSTNGARDLLARLDGQLERIADSIADPSLNLDDPVKFHEASAGAAALASTLREEFLDSDLGSSELGPLLLWVLKRPSGWKFLPETRDRGRRACRDFLDGAFGKSFFAVASIRDWCEHDVNYSHDVLKSSEIGKSIRLEAAIRRCLCHDSIDSIALLCSGRECGARISPYARAALLSALGIWMARRGGAGLSRDEELMCSAISGAVARRCLGRFPEGASLRLHMFAFENPDFFVKLVDSDAFGECLMTCDRRMLESAFNALTMVPNAVPSDHEVKALLKRNFSRRILRREAAMALSFDFRAPGRVRSIRGDASDGARRPFGSLLGAFADAMFVLGSMRSRRRNPASAAAWALAAGRLYLCVPTPEAAALAATPKDLLTGGRGPAAISMHRIFPKYRSNGRMRAATALCLEPSRDCQPNPVRVSTAFMRSGVWDIELAGGEAPRTFAQALSLGCQERVAVAGDGCSRARRHHDDHPCVSMRKGHGSSSAAQKMSDAAAAAEGENSGAAKPADPAAQIRFAIPGFHELSEYLNGAFARALKGGDGRKGGALPRILITGASGSGKTHCARE
ncbi:MAG: hypothetical protein ACI4NA_06365, partial [Succinivibrio sp.]